MKNRSKAYGLAFLVMLYITRDTTTDYQVNVLLAALTACVIALFVEIGNSYVSRKRKETQRQLWLANRRDCIVIAGAWPEEGEDGPDLGPIYNSPVLLYEYYENKNLEQAKQCWIEELVAAGNQSMESSLAEDLRLPVIIVYPQTGEFRMESRKEYAERLKKIIKKANTIYHSAQDQQNEGKNYVVDYVWKR